MSHDQKHDHHGHQHNHQTHPKQKRPIHHDSRFWMTIGAIVLMLAAMIMYVISDDESLQPGGEVGPAVPAAE